MSDEVLSDPSDSKHLAPVSPPIEISSPFLTLRPLISLPYLRRDLPLPLLPSISATYTLLIPFSVLILPRCRYHFKTLIHPLLFLHYFLISPLFINQYMILRAHMILKHFSSNTYRLLLSDVLLLNHNEMLMTLLSSSTISSNHLIFYLPPVAFA